MTYFAVSACLDSLVIGGRERKGKGRKGKGREGKRRKGKGLDENGREWMRVIGKGREG